ncbi:MAG TPA: hypothetical protein VG712_01930 [Gemmatimonadales bacterium]|nr:hypothetical protein [Gemmatimonadales bacterium]
MLFRRLTYSSVLLLLLAASPLIAQRAFRGGLGVSTLTSRDNDASSTGWTLSLGYLTSSTSETSAFLTRWGNTGFGTGADGVTTFGLETRYFPVESDGIAPYLSQGVGLFKYTVPGRILTQPSEEWGFVSAMGLGLGATLGDHLWIGGEGRLRVDNGLRSTELRVQGVYGVGPLRRARSKPGTIEPFVAGIVRLGHGPYTASSPYAGIRFRRDESRHASIAVDAGAAKLTNAGEAVTAWMVQPSAEYGWSAPWGRPFIEIGPDLIGFVGGPDDGMRAGLHTGGGVDLRLSEALELALLSRVTWYQSNDGRHQFGLQLGAAIGPRLMRDRSVLPEKAPAVE